MARVISLAELPDRGGAEYAQGLRAAVEAAVGYALEGMAQGEHEGTPVPEALLAQARRAARSGVGLDTVLRRYVAGHGLLSDFLVQEAEGQVAPAELKRLFRRLAATLDCLLSAVTAAYGLEERRQRRTTEQRRLELVERLLAGEPLDTADLGYEMALHHLGLVGCGPGLGEALPALASALDARLLVLSRERGVVWAWLGRRRPLEPGDAGRRARAALPAGAVLAFGEPAEGELGWRLTHRQAAAALSVAQRGEEPIVSYRDVALLAAGLQDDLLATSLRHLYIDPLKSERDGGTALFRALRAYFASDRNVSSTAAALGVTRKTVNGRLRAAEERLGRPLVACDSDLQLALQIDAAHTV